MKTIKKNRKKKTKNTMLLMLKNCAIMPQLTDLRTNYNIQRKRPAMVN